MAVLAQAIRDIQLAGLIRSPDEKNQMVAKTMQKLEPDRLD